ETSLIPKHSDERYWLPANLAYPPIRHCEYHGKNETVDYAENDKEGKPSDPLNNVMSRAAKAALIQQKGLSQFGGCQVKLPKRPCFSRSTPGAEPIPEEK